MEREREGEGERGGVRVRRERESNNLRCYVLAPNSPPGWSHLSLAAPMQLLRCTAEDVPPTYSTYNNSELLNRLQSHHRGHLKSRSHILKRSNATGSVSDVRLLTILDEKDVMGWDS